MTERDLELQRGAAAGLGSVEPLSPQAWQRVESAVFARLDAAAVPWSLAPAPLNSYAAPRPESSLRLHWATSVGLALASAAAAASVLHLMRPPPQLEAGTPAELVMPATLAPALSAVERTPVGGPAPVSEPAWATPPVQLRPLMLDANPLASEPSHVNLASRGSGRALAPAAGDPVRPRLMRPSTESAPAARPSGRREHEPPPLDREGLFERAASLEAADAALALTLYLSLASGEDDWAANALYAAARLEIDRGRHDAGAAHLAEYLARFPRGENVVDVRGLRRRIGVESP
jgi:hypothetical protein